MRNSWILGTAISLLGLGSTVPTASSANDTYDYVVIGSGAGGGPTACNLARAGYSTLLIEAGGDQSEDISTIIANAYFPVTANANLTWWFFVNHFANEEDDLKHNHLTWKFPNGTLWVGPGTKAPNGTEKVGVLYPRGASLGGSTITNAMATWLPSDSDWDLIKELTGDESWDHERMREIFERIENNHYLEEDTPGHGFDGWLETNQSNGTQYEQVPGTMEVMKAQLRTLGADPDKLIEYLGRDGNYLSGSRDQDTGYYGLPFHATEGWARWSSRTYIFETLAAKNEDGTKKYPLTVLTNSLATQLIWEDEDKESENKRSNPRVVGVTYITGRELYQADYRYNATNNPSSVGTVTANREVIVAGGTFNTPQILQLSGIGNTKHLESVGVDVKVHLPGVGQNLMDNQEFPIVGRGNEAFAVVPLPGDPTCVPATYNDPCYPLWVNGTGPYTRQGANANALMLKTKNAVRDERDLFIFTMPTPFRGFWPPTPQLELIDTVPTMGMSMVKIHPQNHQGFVRIRSSDPRETPEINFKYYEEGAETDINALAEAVAFGRRAFADVAEPWGPMSVAEPPCSREVGEDGSCGEDDRDWIKYQTFGHHATGTSKMGSSDDEMAVVDSNFKVYGVDGLRVVDASVFPESPGPFPVVATFMISQKASDVILNEASDKYYRSVKPKDK